MTLIRVSKEVRVSNLQHRYMRTAWCWLWVPATAAAALTLQSFTPSRGSYLGGTLVNVSGSGFLSGGGMGPV